MAKIILKLVVILLFVKCEAKPFSSDFFLMKLSMVHNGSDCYFYYVVNDGKFYDANYVETFGYEDVEVYNSLDTKSQEKYSLAWSKIQECKFGDLDIIVKGKFHEFRLSLYKINGDFISVSGNFSQSKFSKNIFMGSVFFIQDKILLPVRIDSVEKRSNTEGVLDIEIFNVNLFTKENEGIFFNWCGVN